MALSLHRVTPLGVIVSAAALVAILAIGGCAATPAAPGTDSQGDTPTAVSEVELVDTFPAEDVVLADGVITWSTYEEIGAAGSGYHAEQWFVDIQPAGTVNIDVATDLLEASGWTWDESASMLADGSDRWLFKADYSIQLTQDGSAPFTLQYRVTREITS
jgi:hypothetical protein